MKIAIVAVAAVAAAVITGAGVPACSRSAAPAHDQPLDQVAAWRDDLRALATELPARHVHAFFHATEADWRRAVAALDAQLAGLDDAHAMVGLDRLVAAIGDAHTRMYLPHPTAYPIALLWLEDGIFVGGAAPDHAVAVGQTLVAIDGHPIADVLAALTPLVSHENDAGLKNEIPSLLSSPISLAGADLAPADHAIFTIADAAGHRTDLELRPGAGVALTAPRVLPLHLKGPTQLGYWNTYVADQRLLYFQYNACADDDRVGRFADFAARTLAFADQHPVDRFVIDLRRNSGGDSRVIEPLVRGLEARPALAGRVFVIIGRTTFSSAMMNASELKQRVNVTLVGGPTGGNPNGYGEVKTFTLPHSHLTVQYSTNLFSDARYPGNAVTPDLEVRVTSADWFSGQDPAMDAILAEPVPVPAR